MITLREFILTMMDVPQDMKVVVNTGEDWTERDMRIFLQLYAPTAKQILEEYFRHKNVVFLNDTVTFNKYMPTFCGILEGGSVEVTEIVYHDARLKKDRFYEIKTRKV